MLIEIEQDLGFICAKLDARGGSGGGFRGGTSGHDIKKAISITTINNDEEQKFFTVRLFKLASSI